METTDDVVIGESYPDGECDSCHYGPVTVTAYRPSIAQERRGQTEPNLFCEVCAGTFFSRHVEDANAQIVTASALFPSLAYVANMMLDEVRQLRAEVAESRGPR